MRNNYIATIPATNDMPMFKFVVFDRPSESKEEQALWHYNNSRAHDGLPPLSKLPKGSGFELVN